MSVPPKLFLELSQFFIELRFQLFDGGQNLVIVLILPFTRKQFVFYLDTVMSFVDERKSKRRTFVTRFFE